MGTKPNLKRPEKSSIELKQDFIKNLTSVKWKPSYLLLEWELA
jgi:hypothetical protein